MGIIRATTGSKLQILARALPATVAFVAFLVHIVLGPLGTSKIYPIDVLPDSSCYKVTTASIYTSWVLSFAFLSMVFSASYVCALLLIPNLLKEKDTSFVFGAFCLFMPILFIFLQFNAEVNMPLCNSLEPTMLTSYPNTLGDCVHVEKGSKYQRAFNGCNFPEASVPKDLFFVHFVSEKYGFDPLSSMDLGLIDNFFADVIGNRTANSIFKPLFSLAYCSLVLFPPCTPSCQPRLPCNIFEFIQSLIRQNPFVLEGKYVGKIFKKLMDGKCEGIISSINELAGFDIEQMLSVRPEGRVIFDMIRSVEAHGCDKIQDIIYSGYSGEILKRIVSV